MIVDDFAHTIGVERAALNVVWSILRLRVTKLTGI